MHVDLSSSEPREAILMSAEGSAPIEDAIVPSTSAPRELDVEVERDPSSGRPRLSLLAYLVLALGVICTTLTTAYITATSEARDRGHFRAIVEHMEAGIADRLDADIALLSAGAALVAAQPSATVQDLRGTLAALQPRAHAAVLEDIGISREITSIDPIRRAAMERARDTGVPIATGLLSLAPKGDGEAKVGFVIYAPIYKGGAPPANASGRAEALAGFVHAVFPAGPFFKGILGELADQGRVDVDVYGSADRLPEHILHSSSDDRAPSLEAPRFTTTSMLEIAGRPFALSFSTRPGFERGSSRELIPFILAAGLLTSLILFIAVRSQAIARALAERRAAGLLTSERALREGDLRLQRLMEAEAVARHEAEAASRIRDELLSTLSHEFRTPLTAALGWVRMLRGGALNTATTARALEVIERNVKREVELVEAMLDASVTVTGEIHLDMRPIAIEPIITAAIEAARPAALARSICLEFSFVAVGQRVKGDPARLRQVVWNLLSNAIRFTPFGGRVHVEVRRKGAQVEIAVIDSGRGISPSFLPFVFDRFRKADSSMTYSSGGLGLGLSLVRHLVELHGGAVRAESPGDGKGSIFTVLLPAIPSAVEAPGCAEAKVTQGLARGA